MANIECRNNAGGRVLGLALTPIQICSHPPDLLLAVEGKTLNFSTVFYLFAVFLSCFAPHMGTQSSLEIMKHRKHENTKKNHNYKIQFKTPIKYSKSAGSLNVSSPDAVEPGKRYQFTYLLKEPICVGQIRIGVCVLRSN